MQEKLSRNLPALIFLSLSILETGTGIYSLLVLPVDPKNAAILGFSLSRLAIVGVLFIFFILFTCLFITTIKDNLSRSIALKLIQVPRRYTRLVIYAVMILAGLAFFLLQLPATGLRGMYPTIFERLDPLFLVTGLISLQYLLLLAWERTRGLPKPARRVFWKEFSLKYALPVIVFLFPFFFFFPRTIPINGEYYGIGNDFIPISYTYKVYLLDCLSRLHFPLWSPAEAAGYPFYTNPFSPSFYPLNIPMSLLYFLNGGYSVLDNQRFAVLGISIFAVGLYFWLKEFSLSNRAVFITTVLMSVSFRLAELIRYPTGLHTIAWYPWILLFLNKVTSSTSLKKAVGYALLLVFSGICVITGGYPYYLYYGIFLIIPYLLILFLPVFRWRFFPGLQPVTKRQIVVLGGSALVLGMLTAPYVLRMANLLSISTARGGGDFSFSTSNDFNFIDTLGSLVFPPVSQAEGWYYFGFASLVLIVLFLISRPLFIREKWASPDQGKHWNHWYLHPLVSGTLGVWFVLISYITYGKSSLLFVLLWKYFPFFSHLRFIGRLNFVLLPIIAVLLAMAIDCFSQVLGNIRYSQPQEKKSTARWMLLVLVACAIPAGVLFYVMKFQPYDYYWTRYFFNSAGQESLFAFMACMAVGLFFLAFYVALRWKKSAAAIFWILFTALNLANLWPVAGYMWWNGTTFVKDDVRKPIQVVDRIFMESFQHKRSRTPREDSMNITAVYRVNYSDDWYFSFYQDFFRGHEYESDARDRLLGVTDGTRVFFSRSISYENIADYLRDADSESFFYKIKSFNGDRLELSIEAPEDGYVSYIDNWDPDWKVSVNGQAVPVEKLFSTFKTVRVQKGTSEIVFSYEPNYFELDWQKFSKK